MIELDDHAKALRDHGADLATDLREHAMLVDTDPYDMKPHLDLPAYELIRYFQTPPEFSDGPVRIGRFTYEPRSVLQQVVLTLELAYGDAGMALACPSPSLAGVLVGRITRGVVASQEDGDKPEEPAPQPDPPSFVRGRLDAGTSRYRQRRILGMSARKYTLSTSTTSRLVTTSTGNRPWP
ncbi:hypothetical protein ACFQ1S_11995 [Kibdelosporangium lantanae]|uniref:Uncharacterized protein n=1 Tax=Kibdelosporangium lantanae TaxID=1497396 RepID=A0ABW3M7A2_9PSEU